MMYSSLVSVVPLLCALAFCSTSTEAFVGQNPASHQRTSTSLQATRREALVSTVGLVGLLVGNAPAAQADTGAEVRGIGVTPFNSLMFQYRGSESANGGVLKSSDIDEPTISYTEFCEKLKTGDVKFVEFMAPDGDAAYATIEGLEKPIRVGEGKNSTNS